MSDFKRTATTSDLEVARNLFHDEGLAFPNIPEQLAAKLREQDEWLFSSESISRSWGDPYFLENYFNGEIIRSPYVVLAHSGHGSNSYAIYYYLVTGSLRLFLELAWGGVYMDAEEATSNIRECFSLANEIVPVTMTSEKFAPRDQLTIVASSFNGSYWSVQGQSNLKKRGLGDTGPSEVEVLTEALQWLNDHGLP